MKDPKILKTENLKIQIVTVETNNGFHSGSIQDNEDSWLIAISDRDRAERGLYEVSRILNDISDDTVELLRIWAGLNEYGRQELLEFAEAMMDSPEYQKAEIIDFPVGAKDD